MTSDGSHASGRSAEWRAHFDPFMLTPSQHLLQRDGARVRLGGRALDLLIALVESAGEVVSKQDLMARVWPDVVVEEGNLRVHMVALRKALADGEGGNRIIVNVPNKGYAFVAQVRRIPMNAAPTVPIAGHTGPMRPWLGSLVGREEDISGIVNFIRANRLVSIVGPGGMGKTTVAAAAARVLSDEFADRVYFVDLSSIASADLLPSAVAAALGVQHGSDNPGTIAARIGRDRTLLVLDCCEHVIARAADLAGHLMAHCPAVSILATTREPLRTAGEFVFRLQPLKFPSDGQGNTAASALAFPAVKLLVDRAAASGGFVLKDEDALPASRLCRELGGNALAIEVAAGRVVTLGLDAIMSHFDARARLSWHGKRTAVPRHQTLSATLEWSYRLLSSDEQQLLRRLSVFAASFTLEAAFEICCHDYDKEAATELLIGLVDKSLLNVDPGGSALRYRLFDTTKAFGWEKLQDCGEQEEALQRLSRYFCSLILSREEQGVIEKLALELPNLRTSIEWFFQSDADPAGATRFACALCALLSQLSQLKEGSRLADVALSRLAEPLRGSRYEALLHAHSARGKYLLDSGSQEEAERAYQHGIVVAERLHDHPTTVDLMQGYAVQLHRGGKFREALTVARRAEALVKGLGDEDTRAMIDSLMGAALHLTGHILEATQYLERVVSSGSSQALRSESRIGFDVRIRSMAGLAHILWLRGRYSESMDTARRTIELAQTANHAVTYCIALIWAGAVFAWIDQLDLLEETVGRLEDVAGRHAFAPYLSIAAAVRGQIALKQGRTAEGVEKIRGAVQELHALRYEMVTSPFLTLLADGLSTMRLHQASIELCDEVAGSIREGGDLVRLPELLTVRGRALAAAGREEDAASSFRTAIGVARSQGARSAELRAALFHARFLIDAGHGDEGCGMLRLHVDAAGGETSPDLVAARRLLA